MLSTTPRCTTVALLAFMLSHCGSGEPPQKIEVPPTVWNLWAELDEDGLKPAPGGEKPDQKPGLLFSPVEFLKPDSAYWIVLDLSAVAYSESLNAQPSGEVFQQRLKTWLQRVEQPTQTVTTVILPDPAFFKQSRPIHKPFEVNLAKIREFIEGDLETPDDPFEIFLRQSDPQFLFGRQFFHVETNDREGAASIGISIWDKGRPIDEIVFPVCVSSDVWGDPCGDFDSVPYTWRGVDSLRVADGAAPYPDAALHFLELLQGAPMGVFYANERKSADQEESENYLVWHLGEDSLSSLRRVLDTEIVTGFGHTSDQDQLKFVGRLLFSLLFPNGNQAQRSARKAFIAWVGKSIPLPQKDQPKEPAEPSSPALPPTLFVRVLGRDGEPELRIPLGLANVQVDQDREVFLGFHFRIETPLPVQDYGRGNSCPSRWVMALPVGSKDADLRIAGERISHRFDDWKSGSQKFFSELREFGEWLLESDDAEDPIDDAGKAPASILMLAHHDSKNQRLFFDKDNDWIPASSVQRTFGAGSIAIIDACKTGGPGLSEFIRRFNENNVQAVIATNTEVDSAMAGDFLGCLDQNLKGASLGISISLAHFLALKCLRDTKKPLGISKGVAVPSPYSYGARALAFSFYGNGDLPLCAPGEN